MFWSFMNHVHDLPRSPEDRQLWWTDAEKLALAILNHQLSYQRIGTGVGPSIFPNLEQELIGKGVDWETALDYHCFSPSLVLQDGELVWGLEETWAKFLERHLQAGKYLGAITLRGLEESSFTKVFICHNKSCVDTKLKQQGVHDKFHELQKRIDEGDPDDYDDMNRLVEILVGINIDIEGIGITHEASAEEVVTGMSTCPICGDTTGPLQFDESPDVETLMVFEKGSFAYAHYGRGAGMSFRFHTNLKGFEDGMDPMVYFRKRLGS